LAFAPFNAWWLAFIVFPIWFYLQTKLTEHSFKAAWFFNFGYFAAGVSWIHVSIAEHGGLPLIISIGMIAVLCAYLALFPAFAIWLSNRLFNKRLWPFALPLIWLAMEWARAHFLTGFPWLSIGYSQLEGPLSGWLPVIGEIGVSAMLVLITLSLGLSFRIKQQNGGWKIYGLQSLLLTGIVCVSGLVLNSINWTLPTGVVKTVTMIQGNIEQTVRWVPEQDRPIMQKYWNLSADQWQSDIIIWPEAAIPKLEIAAAGFLDLLDGKAADTNTALITGIVDVNYSTEIISNNLLSLGNDKEGENSLPYTYGHQNRFAKHHLLPIGEFVPFESFLRDVAPIFDLPMSSFARGDYVQANLLANGISLAPAICFEIAFPNQIRANLVEDTDAIITVSNDAWFGDSHGPHQHLEIAQMRAKEFGLPIFRSTNNGVTAFIDHKGAISAVAPQFEDAVLTQKVSLVDGTTPYRKYGNLPTYLFFILLFSIGIFLKRRQIKVLIDNEKHTDQNE
jgi:apolipoprotein N-acyltransferase